MHGTISEHRSTHYLPLVEEEEPEAITPNDDGATQRASGSPRTRLLIEEPSTISEVQATASDGRLNIRETLRLSFEFCILWVGIIVVETDAR